LAWAWSGAWAQDPALQWYTLETEHFVIHYHEGQGDMPQRAALACEQAHAILAPLLDWEPAERTQVVLDDQVDTANGFASIVPRNTIRLYAYPPPARSALGDYDDWFLGLILHEYTHILHIDNISGLPSWLNEALGKFDAPNQLLPRWYTEGFATYQESARTGGGRVRSSLFRMYLRTAFLEGAFFDIGQLSGSPQAWPRGASWYLYGSFFVAWVAEKYGEEMLNRFHTEYGSIYIPYSMNRTLQQTAGKDFVSLYHEWHAHVAGQSLAQRVALRLEGLTPLERLTAHGNVADDPVARPKHGQVSFYASNGEEQSGLYAHDLATGEVVRLISVEDGGGQHAWTPDGERAVLHAARFFRNTYVYNDLVQVEPRTRVETRLSWGLRAKDPDLSPDGASLVYVEAGQGRTSLGAYDTATQTRELWVQGAPLWVFDNPRFDPSGRWVAVSLWRDARGRDIYLWDRARRRLVQLTQDRALDLEPNFSPDGRWLVFASDRTGIYNIYALDLDGLDEKLAALGEADREAAPPRRPSDASPDDARAPGVDLYRLALPARQVTRVESGVFTPVVVEDGPRRWLYVSLYGAQGNDLARMPFDPASFLPGEAEGSRLARPVIAYPALGEVVERGGDYEPWRYLGPLGYSPLTAYSTTGRGTWGLELAGGDPVGRHFWSAVGEWFPEDESFFALSGYQYGGWPITVGASAQYSRYERPQGRLVESRLVATQEEAWDGQVTLGLPVRSLDAGHRFALGYNARWVRPLEDEAAAPTRHRPDDIPPTAPEPRNASALVLSYGVGDADRFVGSVSSEQGYSLNATLRLRDPALGGELRSVQATTSGAVYVPMPWRNNHALALRLSAGIARREGRAEQFTVGGVPPQQTVSALLNQAPLGGSFLRGFRFGAFAGEQYWVSNAEYRLPVWDVETGLDTFPFRLGRLALAGFVDHGAAFDGAFADADFHLGVGAELWLSITLGYALPASFRLGYAHGFGAEGVDDLYFYLGTDF
jgi:hypothetical protein